MRPEGLDSEQTQALPWGRPFKMETWGGGGDSVSRTDQIDLKDNPARDAAEIDVHVSMRRRR